MMLGSGILGAIAQFSSIGVAMHVNAALLVAATAGFGWAAASVAEVVDTFVLCFVVLSVAISSFRPAIGSCVTAGGYAISSAP